MCFPKAPKPPKSVDSGADQALTRERRQAELDAAAIRASNKEIRMEDELARLTGRQGRRSLFTGGQGGIGYPGIVRSFTGAGAAPNPASPPPVANPGPTGGGGFGPGGRGGTLFARSNSPLVRLFNQSRAGN
jgi:hypothetical protein